jgi:hypothetical protein
MRHDCSPEIDESSAVYAVNKSMSCANRAFRVTISAQRFQRRHATPDCAEIVMIHAQPPQDCAAPRFYHERHENPQRNRFAHGR